MLEDEFTRYLFVLADRTYKETKYNPTAFKVMVEKYGGVGAAKSLIRKNRPSEGYIRLYELKRLDLTIEAQILENEEWHSLFSEEELKMCKNRLRDYGYPI